MGTINHTTVIHFNRYFFVRLFKWFIVLLLLGFAITLLTIMKTLMFTLIISVLMACLLEPIIRLIENYDIKRIWAIMIVFMSAAVTVAFGMYFFLPVITAELQTVSCSLQLKHPSLLTDEIKTTIERDFPFMKQSGLSSEMAAYIHHTFEDLIQESIDILLEFVHIISLIFTVPVFTFFFLKDGQLIKKTLIQLVPNRYFEIVLILIYKINQQLVSYIRGQMLSAFFVGTCSVAILSILDIRYAFLIGSFAGCANIIPHFGPIVGAIPAIIIALMETGSFTLALTIVVSFVAIQLLDYLFISHMVAFKHVHMHPAMVFVIVFIGGYFMGAIGMFSAALLAGIVKVTITELMWGFRHYHIFGHKPQFSGDQNKVV